MISVMFVGHLGELALSSASMATSFAGVTGFSIMASIPSALMNCLEGWSYEFLVLMSGLLPNPKLETSMMSISLNTSSAVFRIAFGFGSAVRYNRDI
ncbi:hypothetical protein LguiB_007740 [Lonicera macranthoides]